MGSIPPKPAEARDLGPYPSIPGMVLSSVQVENDMLDVSDMDTTRSIPGLESCELTYVGWPVGVCSTETPMTVEPLPLPPPPNETMTQGWLSAPDVRRLESHGCACTGCRWDRWLGIAGVVGLAVAWWVVQWM